MNESDVLRDCEHCREKMHERFSAFDRRTTTLEVTLWGQTGNNGLRSDIKDLRRKMDLLLRFFWVTSALPPITVALLGILKFLGKL
jgi:hypothetical protein